MAIYFNGTKINSFDFNGNKPEKVYFNNTLVHQNKNPLDNCLYFFPTGGYDWWDDADSYASAEYRDNASSVETRLRFAEEYSSAMQTDFIERLGYTLDEYLAMENNFGTFCTEFFSAFDLGGIELAYIDADTSIDTWASGVGGFAEYIDVVENMINEYINMDEINRVTNKFSLFVKLTIGLFGFIRIPLLLREDLIMFVDFKTNKRDDTMVDMCLSFLRVSQNLNTNAYPDGIGLIGATIEDIFGAQGPMILILMGYNGEYLIDPRRY